MGLEYYDFLKSTFGDRTQPFVPKTSREHTHVMGKDVAMVRNVSPDLLLMWNWSMRIVLSPKMPRLQYSTWFCLHNILSDRLNFPYKSVNNPTHNTTPLLLRVSNFKQKMESCFAIFFSPQKNLSESWNTTKIGLEAIHINKKTRKEFSTKCINVTKKEKTSQKNFSNTSLGSTPLKEGG